MRLSNISTIGIKYPIHIRDDPRTVIVFITKFCRHLRQSFFDKRISTPRLKERSQCFDMPRIILQTEVNIVSVLFVVPRMHREAFHHKEGKNSRYPQMPSAHLDQLVVMKRDFRTAHRLRRIPWRKAGEFVRMELLAGEKIEVNTDCTPFRNGNGSVKLIPAHALLKAAITPDGNEPLVTKTVQARRGRRGGLAELILV